MPSNLLTKNYLIASLSIAGLFLMGCQPQASLAINTNNQSFNLSSKFSSRATTAWNSCSINSLQAAEDFNVFIIGDSTLPSADTQGRLAIGGNAYISNYSVGDQLLPDASRIDLLVGGNLEFPSGAVLSGRTVYGGALAKTDAASSYGGFQQENQSSFFSSATNAVRGLSVQLGAMQINGVVSMDFTGGSKSFTYLTGTNSQVNVVAIDTDDLERTHTLIIAAPASSTMLVNVYGEEAVFASMGMQLTGITKDSILFNFVDAKKLYMSNIAIESSVLAPLAQVTFAAGQLNGQFVGGSFYGQGQFNNNPFTGCLPTPSTSSTPYVQNEFTTYTQGGWGAKPNGNNPANTLANNFSSVFPSGVTVGLSSPGYSMSFTTAAAIANYLPAGSTASALNSNLTNPTSTSSGVFGGQVLALKLNVKFADANIIGTSSIKFGNLVVRGTGFSIDGLTVRAVLAKAEQAIAGSGLPSGMSFSDLNNLVTSLNEAFDNGAPTSWAQSHLLR
jgi:choice-of-anchor A domain-containing protein